MRKNTLILIGSLTMLLAACGGENSGEKTGIEQSNTQTEHNASSVDLSSEKAKLSYAIGNDVARAIIINGKVLQDIDVETTLVGIKDTLGAKGPALSDSEMTEVLNNYAAKRQVAAAAKAEQLSKDGVVFLEANKSKAGVVTTESGLQYVTHVEGSGASPVEESLVEINYQGILLNGDVFDTSKGNPVVTSIIDSIAGLREGIMLMKAGGKSTFYIPSELAYGKDAPPQIGADQLLIFEIELLSVK